MVHEKAQLIASVALAKKLALLGVSLLGLAAVAIGLLRRKAMTTGRMPLAKGLTLAGWLVLSPIGLGAALYADMAWIEPNWIQVERVVVRSPELAPSLKGVKIVQISDLHVLETVPWRVLRMVGIINRLKADVIVITGDFVSSRGGMEVCLSALDRLGKPRFGIWAVAGNTDEIFYDQDELKQLCRQHGIRMLINERVQLSWEGRPTFYLAGVDDPTYRKDLLNETLEAALVNHPVLLLAHSPSDRIVNQAAQRGVPLLLVGHTHGGQVGIPWIRNLSPYANRTPYMAGLYQVKGTHLYVNRGIGTKTRELRLLCRPEITLLEIKE